MTDQGAQRRQARQFEPPPWERDKFDELKRSRAEEEPVPEGADAGSLPPGEVVLDAPPLGAFDTAPTPGASGGSEIAGIDEERLDTMMFELRAEEPSARQAGWQLRVAVAVFLLIVGTVMILWGMVALVKVTRIEAEQRMLAGLVSLAFLIFGAGFIGLSGWLGYQVYQQRGVQ